MQISIIFNINFCALKSGFIIHSSHRDELWWRVRRRGSQKSPSSRWEILLFYFISPWSRRSRWLSSAVSSFSIVVRSFFLIILIILTRDSLYFFIPQHRDEFRHDYSFATSRWVSTCVREWFKTGFISMNSIFDVVRNKSCYNSIHM